MLETGEWQHRWIYWKSNVSMLYIYTWMFLSFYNMSLYKMRKSAWKMSFLAWVINIWKSGFTCKFSMRKTIYLQFTILNTLIKCTCHLNSKHARNLKFWMHFPCVAFHRFGEAILEILLFGRFMAKKLPKNPIWSAYFGTFLIKS